jgi:hypothetical protein
LLDQLVVGDANRAVVQFEAAGLVAMQFQDVPWRSQKSIGFL